MRQLKQREYDRRSAETFYTLAGHMLEHGARGKVWRSWRRLARTRTPRSLLHKGGKP